MFIFEKGSGLNTYEFSPLSKYAQSCFISNESQWPSLNQFKFDFSQYEALKLALTNKIALIQG
jgi:hypothetical protein